MTDAGLLARGSEEPAGSGCDWRFWMSYRKRMLGTGACACAGVALALVAGCASAPTRTGADEESAAGPAGAAEAAPGREAAGPSASSEAEAAGREEPPEAEAEEGAAEVTDANLDKFVSRGVALIDFWATWCPPCRVQGPIVEKIAEEYRGRVRVGKLDVDGNRKSAARFEVQAIPTLIVFKDGEVARKLVGLQDENQLRAALDEASK
jgi:thioredoxin 1